MKQDINSKMDDRYSEIVEEYEKKFDRANKKNTRNFLIVASFGLASMFGLPLLYKDNSLGEKAGVVQCTEQRYILSLLETQKKLREEINSRLPDKEHFKDYLSKFKEARENESRALDEVILKMSDELEIMERSSDVVAYKENLSAMSNIFSYGTIGAVFGIMATLAYGEYKVSRLKREEERKLKGLIIQ